MSTLDTDASYALWREFRAAWTETITSPFGLFAYDPTARAHIINDGIELFDYDPAWILPARFEPVDEPGSIELQIAHSSSAGVTPAPFVVVSVPIELGGLFMHG